MTTAAPMNAMRTYDILDGDLKHQICAFAASLLAPTPLTTPDGISTFEVLSKFEEGTINISLNVGFGIFSFVWKEAWCQLIRKKVGSPMNVQGITKIHEMVQILAPCEMDVCQLLREATTWYEKQNEIETKVQLYRWIASSEWWKRENQLTPRNWESVILDTKVEKTLMRELEDMESEETRSFHKKHAIPFRRGILLHGPPGTGKTSLIHAVATKLRRKVYRISLVAPKLCDDSLRAAIATAEENSIFVFEDIDSLFGMHREKTEVSNVTFSGLLNSLDGLGNTESGSVFIYTSNHPEKLDPALKRKGRMDIQLFLGPCSTEQVKRMFLRFYPGETGLAEQFCTNVRSLKRACTPADLQHHFLLHRRSAASEALAFTLDFETEIQMYA